MIQIKSKKVEEKVLHLVYRASELTEDRTELVTPDQFIQCAYLNMKKGKTFRPHKHIWKEFSGSVIAQESWVIIRGSVRVLFYDIDGSYLTSYVLNSGDSSFTLEGGHTYEILEDDTVVYEYKTGPYEGQKRDKEFIDDDRV